MSMRNWVRRVPALALATAMSATPAAAQTILLDAITIIATKTEELAINTLAPVSTVRQDQIQQLAPSRPHQIFFGVPGVNTEATAQDPSSAINIRGLQDFGRVAVYVDGARQNYARLNHDGAGSFFLETEILAGADVIRGPSSNIYGSGAIGGVVTLRSKDVDDILTAGQLWGIEANLTGGTNGFNGVGSIFAASRLSPNAEFMFGGSIRDQDSYKTGDGTKIPNSGQEVQTFIAKATFRPLEDHQIKFSTILYNSDWKSGIPPGTFGLAPTSNERGWNSLNITTSGNWKYRPSGNALIDFDATAYWNRVDVTSTLLSYYGGPVSPIYGPIGTRTNYIIDTLGFDVNNTSRFETGNFRHALTYGVDLFNDNVGNTATAGFGAGYNPRGERTVGGTFVQLKSNYSTWLEVITALRYDAFAFTGVDTTTGAQLSTDGDRLSPKITIGITPFTGFQPYFSYAEGYRAPSVTETLVSQQHPPPATFQFIPNLNLRPETGKNSELGFNVKYDDLLTGGDKLRIKASVFRNNVDDFIDTVLIASGVGPCTAPVTCSQYQNVARARIEGFEFESMYDRGDWFLGFAGHVLRGRNLDDGTPVTKIPTNMFATTFGMRFLDGKLQAAIRWAAYAAKKSEDIAPGSVELPTGSYNLVNLYVGYQIDPTLLAAVSVENLLNEQYRVYTHEFASPGMTVKLSLRKTFGPAPDITATVNNHGTTNLRPTATAMTPRAN